jgi:hypothetical protein
MAAITSPPIQLAYLSEIPKKVEQVSQAGFAPSAQSIAPEIESTKKYLVMLGALRSIEYCVYLRQIQGAFGFTDNGKPRADLNMSGWPAGKTFIDLLEDPEVKKLNIPPHVIARFKAQYEKIFADLQAKAKSTDPKEAKAAQEEIAKRQNKPFKVFVDLYNHFAYEVLDAYTTEIFGAKAVDGRPEIPPMDLLGRLQSLNGMLPEKLRINFASLTLNNSASADLSNLDVKSLGDAIKTLQASSAGLDGTQKNILQEMTLISLMLTIKYMMGIRSVQNSVGIKDDKSNWPMSGGRQSTWTTLVNGAAGSGVIDDAVKTNLLSVLDKRLTFNDQDQYKRFKKTYYYYGEVFSDLLTSLVGTSDARHDPLDTIKAVNRMDLCSLLKTAADPVKPDEFNEMSFLAEVKDRVKPENLVGCVDGMMQGDLEGITKLWSNYIQRVYAAFGRPLSEPEVAKVKGAIIRGLGHDEAGITNADMQELTMLVEAHRPEAQVSLTGNAYDVIGDNLHVDPNSVPSKLDWKDFTGTGVFRKLGNIGIKPAGAHIPRGKKVPQ